MPLGTSIAYPTGNIKPRPVTGGRPEINDQQTSFAGGLNTVSAEDALGPNQFRRGENCRLTPFGAVVKRGGLQRTHTSALAAADIQNGYTWNKGDGSNVIMAVCGGTLSTGTYGSFPITYTQRGGVADLSTTVTPSLRQFISATGTESVYIADGGLLNRYTGTTLTLNLAGTASCRVLEVHNERLWGAVVSSAPQSIFYSALNNGDTLGVGASAGGEIIVRTFGDQRVTGLCSLATSLLIFHQSGVSRLTGYGQDDISVSPAGITGDVGTIAAHSVVRVNNVVYFVSERGLYVATEQDVLPVSSPSQPDPLASILMELGAGELAEIRAVLNRATRELQIWIPGTGVYYYHTILKAWCGPQIDGYLDPSETTCLFETLDTTGYPVVFRGDDDGFLSLTDPPGFNLDDVLAAGTGGTSYAMALQPRRFYCSEPHVSKAWRYAYVLCALNGSDNANVSWSTETAFDTEVLPDSTAAAWGTGTWGGGTTVWGAPSQTSYQVDIDGHGYYIDLIISDSSSNLPVFSQVEVAGFPLGRR